jgi:acyl-CoA thioester hydrolase
MDNKFITDYFTIRIGDINYGGHMGYDKALSLFHDARIAFINSLGYTELNIGENSGIIIGEAYVKYKKEIFLNDNLRVFITISEIKDATFIMNYSVFKQDDDKEAISGYTKVVSFSFLDKKVDLIPKDFLEKLEHYKKN